MQGIGSILEDLATRNNSKPGDYIEDEILMCGNCRTQKQTFIDWPDFKGGHFPRLVPVACKCEQERLAAEEAERKRRDFEQRTVKLRRDGITDPAYLQNTFANDDRRNAKYSEVCEKYVESWEDMRADNIGILFYGSVGTGKSRRIDNAEERKQKARKILGV